MRENFWKIEQRTRILMSIHKDLQTREDKYRLYVSRKKGRGIANMEDCINAYNPRNRGIQKVQGKKLIATASNSNVNILTYS